MELLLLLEYVVFPAPRFEQRSSNKHAYMQLLNI
jgi:hypothetical protein